jgi:hypothetical protein
MGLNKCGSSISSVENNEITSGKSLILRLFNDAVSTTCVI